MTIRRSTGLGLIPVVLGAVFAVAPTGEAAAAPCPRDAPRQALDCRQDDVLRPRDGVAPPLGTALTALRATTTPRLGTSAPTGGRVTGGALAETPRAVPPALADISGRWHFEGVTDQGRAGFWFDFEEPDDIGAGDVQPIAGRGANDAAFAVPLPRADAAAWDGRTTGTYHYDPRSGRLDIEQRGYTSPVTGRSYSLSIGAVVTKDPRDRGGIRAVSGLFTVWDVGTGTPVGTGVLSISPPGSGKNVLHY
jgi:hypothetical protein